MVSPPVNLRSAGIVVNSPRTRLSFSSTDYLCAAQSYAIHWYGVEWYGVEWIPIQSIGNAFQLVSIPFGMDDDGFGAGEITTVPDAVTVRTRHPQRVPEPVRDLFGGWEQGSKRVLAHVRSLRDKRPYRAANSRTAMALSSPFSDRWRAATQPQATGGAHTHLAGACVAFRDCTTGRGRSSSSGSIGIQCHGMTRPVH